MFTIKQGDTSPSLKATLLDGEDVIDLSTVDQINFYIEDEYQRIIVDADLSNRVNILDADLGRVEYVFAESDTSNVGTYKGEWEVVFDSSSNRVETFPTDTKQTIKVVEGVK